MPVYGEPDLGINYVFVAVFPITAEHPIGSGNIVTYKPGDVFPGEEWGNAAHNLVEVGKAVRLATNIEPVQVAAPVETVEQQEDEVTDSYPLSTGGGWFTLSDGSRVRGEEAAFEAQSNLDSGGDPE